MAIGIIKWFNNKNKFGFIEVEKKEFPTSFSSLLGKGCPAMKKGQKVACDIVTGRTGERVINVENR